MDCLVCGFSHSSESVCPACGTESLTISSDTKDPPRAEIEADEAPLEDSTELPIIEAELQSVEKESPNPRQYLPFGIEHAPPTENHLPENGDTLPFSLEDSP